MLALRLGIAIALSANLGSVVLAQSEGRFEANCGLLVNNIYCFGGTVLTKENKENSDQTINVLDITTNNGLPTDQLATKWNSISSDTNGVDLAVRTNPLGLALPDGENMVLIGGWNFASSRLKNHAIVFNAKSRKWTAYPNYQESPYGERQIYSGSATYIPSKGLALYGGFETHRNDAYALNGVNMTTYNTDSDGRRIGFPNLTLFDINNKASPWSVPTQTNLPPITAGFPNYQASVLDPKTNILYYIGGSSYNGAQRGYNYYPLSKAMTFNLNTGAWGSQELSGAYTPTIRFGHSVTMLPTGRDILLYGGSAYGNNMLPVSDYCFTLNLDTFAWTQQSVLNAPPGSKLERTKHAVVLVNNTAFVVFGKDSTNAATNTVLTLDVSNPLNVTYINKHVNPNIPLYSSQSNQTTQDPQDPQNGGSSLSTGAIAGIAVGAVAAGIIGILGILFCLRKKKKEALAGEDNNNAVNEVADMEVNWDEIEKNYVEVPTGRFTYSPNLADNTTIYNSEESSSPMLTQKEVSTIQRPDVTLQSPNAIDDKHVSSFHYHNQIQKPDGGSS